MAVEKSEKSRRGSSSSVTSKEKKDEKKIDLTKRKNSEASSRSEFCKKKNWREKKFIFFKLY